MNRRVVGSWLRSLQQRSTTFPQVRWLVPLTKLQDRVPATARVIGRLPRVDRGLPPVLDDPTVRQLCDDLGIGATEATWSVGLNSWRRSAWTSRLFLRGVDGRVTTVICRATDYEDQLPGARGLPLRPGPPEVAVLGSSACDEPGGLEEFLPSCHLSRPIGPGRHLFILEDLGSTHRIRYDHSSAMRVVDRLADLHGALAEWAGAGPWLDYESALGSPSFRDYVERHLSSYAGETDSHPCRSVLERVDDLVAACTWPPWPDGASVLVHGDANVANVLHPRRTPPNSDGDRPSDIRFIDWEWAGYNLPHADLAALVKALDERAEARAVSRFASQRPQWTRAQHWTMYNQAKLARSLLDASFLSAQRTAIRPGARLDIEGPLARALQAWNELRWAAARP